MKVGDFITNEDLGSAERVQALRNALINKGYDLDEYHGESCIYEKGGIFGLCLKGDGLLWWSYPNEGCVRRTVKYDDVMSELLGDDYKPNSKSGETTHNVPQTKAGILMDVSYLLGVLAEKDDYYKEYADVLVTKLSEMLHE